MHTGGRQDENHSLSSHLRNLQLSDEWASVEHRSEATVIHKEQPRQWPKSVCKETHCTGGWLRRPSSLAHPSVGRHRKGTALNKTESSQLLGTKHVLPLHTLDAVIWHIKMRKSPTVLCHLQIQTKFFITGQWLCKRKSPFLGNNKCIQGLQYVQQALKTIQEKNTFICACMGVCLCRVGGKDSKKDLEGSKEGEVNEP